MDSMLIKLLNWFSNINSIWSILATLGSESFIIMLFPVISSTFVSKILFATKNLLLVSLIAFITNDLRFLLV